VTFYSAQLLSTNQPIHAPRCRRRLAWPFSARDIRRRSWSWPSPARSFHVIGATSRALHKAGVPGKGVYEFFRQAVAGDYDNLLRVMMSWVTVTDSRELLEEE